MTKGFEIFWTEYLRERENYRDDAWENILRRCVFDLPLNEEKIIIDALVEKCINRQQEFSDWAFETFDELASEVQIGKLKKFTYDCIKNDIPVEKYADLIVFFIKKDYGIVSEKVYQIIKSADFSNIWNYILKNTFARDKEIFIAGLQRYLKEKNELGFDIGTFIKHAPDVRRFVTGKINGFQKFEKELTRY
jgi:hypothetical protein